MDKITPKVRCPNCRELCMERWCQNTCALAKDNAKIAEAELKARKKQADSKPKAEKRSAMCLNNGAVFETATSAARLLGVHDERVQDSCSKGKVVYGLTFKWVPFSPGAAPDELQLSQMRDIVNALKCNTPPRKVFCVTNNKRYDTVAQAAFLLGISESLIRKVCNGARPHTHNMVFKWQRDGVDNGQ